MILRLYQPSLAGVGAGAEVGKKIREEVYSLGRVCGIENFISITSLSKLNTFDLSLVLVF